MSFGNATEFISFLPPPGTALDAYIHNAPHDQQPSSVPATFKEAMEVREDVYVKEQKCSLENEVDTDDARSFHWVVYASVGTTSSPSPPINSSPTGGAKGDERRASESTASRVPVGTIRLVPPPHTPHTHAQSPEPTGDPKRSDSKTPTYVCEPKEPYIKLGRLATIAPYRGLGLSKLLYNAAVNWASQHPTEIIPPMSPAELEAYKLEGKKEPDFWEGLVLVHAQSDVQGLWEKFGFKVDKEMGSWIEEGIEHVGLWKRLPVKGLDSGKSVEDAWSDKGTYD
jgi:predicted GNAT family N-acyltransferase